MGLKLIKDRGKVRKAWYGQYRENGVWKVIKLSTPMRGGRIPTKLTEIGDEAFERSRTLAQEEFNRFEADRCVKGTCEHLTRILIESKSGKKIDNIKLDELPSKWRMIPRSYSPTEERMKNADRIFAKFSTFSKSTYLYEITPEIATAFFNKIKKEYAWSSVQGIMSLLKNAFTRFLPLGSQNPFATVITRNRELNATRISRRPLSENELTALIETSRSDPMLHALAVTTACTGMRIGDVCNLKWTSVDLRSGFIDVMTAKAGKAVSVPILGPLRKILEYASTDYIKNKTYVFPDAAKMYKNNPDGIYRRGKVLFAKALFAPQTKQDKIIIDETHVEKSPAEIIESIKNAGYTNQKKERCIRVYTMYATGLTYRQIERETGFSRGQIADYLHGIEHLTGNTIVKWSNTRDDSNSALLRKTRQKREIGKCSASLFGWHSLRASFVVTALNAGIPIEMVRRIVGHSTTRMTEEYFNPTKTIIAETMKRKMADRFIGGCSINSIKTSAASTPSANYSHQTTTTNDIISKVAGMISTMTDDEREQIASLLKK